MKPPFLKEMYLDNTDFDSNIFPFNITFIKNKNFHLKFSSSVTIIAGDNGSGKSTILKTIAYNCDFNLKGGNKDHIYTNNKNSNIEKCLLLNKYLRFSWLPKITTGFYLADNLMNFANYIDEQAQDYGRKNVFSYYGGKSLNEQSHGESYLSLFYNRFEDEGIYILDEPEQALSPSKLLSLICIIKEISDTGKAQFIIATHSPILMAYPKAQFFYINNGIIEETSFDETEHYEITKTFLENPDRYFKHLFDNRE